MKSQTDLKKKTFKLSEKFELTMFVLTVFDLYNKFNDHLSNLFFKPRALHLTFVVVCCYRGFKIVGPFVVMIYTMVRTDLLRFFFIYLVFVIGFSQGKGLFTHIYQGLRLRTRWVWVNSSINVTPRKSKMTKFSTQRYMSVKEDIKRNLTS